MSQAIAEGTRPLADKLAFLMNVSKEINSTRDLDSLLNLIMNYAAEIIGAEGSSLMLIDREAQELVFNVVTGEGEVELKEVRVPLGKGIAGKVAQTGEPIVVNDAEQDDRIFREADRASKMVTRDLLCVPMRAKEEIVGVLEVINLENKDAYDEEDVEMLTALADAAAIAVNNRTLYNDLKRRHEEISALYEVSHAAGAMVELGDRALQRISEVVAGALNCERCSIAIFDEGENCLRMKAGVGVRRAVVETVVIPTAGGIAGYVFRKGVPLLCDNVDRDPRFGRWRRYRYRTRSFMIVPLMSQGRVIGVLAVTERKDCARFSIEDLQMITAVAAQVSESYENIILYRESVEKHRMEKELEIAYRMQQSLLPEVFPETRGCDIAATSIPALEVGGDIYDFVRLARDRFAIYVADVSGKGVPSALFMAMCRSVVRVLGGKGPPAKVLVEANRYIYDDSKTGMFVTMFYLVCDRKTKSLRYASAGHDRMLLVRRGGKKVSYLKTRGIPLGVLPTARYRESVVKYQPGDVLVLVTDGVFEAQNEQREQFGEERLLEVVREHMAVEPGAIVDEIRRAITDFTGEAPQFDDITLVVIKFR